MIRLNSTEGFVACDETIATHYYEYPAKSVEGIDLAWCDQAVEGLELSPGLQAAIEDHAQDEQLDGELPYLFWEAWGEDVPGVVELGDAIRKAAPRLTREILAERVFLRADMIVTPAETAENARSWGLGE